MLRNFYISLLISFACFIGHAQDCTLDIGGDTSETIKKVFQLNEAQIGTMETLRGELHTELAAIEMEIEKLLAEHPQSKEEDLVAMGDKYKILQQKVIAASWESDKKMLETFNLRQYERYLQLCKAAARLPIKITPKTYESNIPKE